LRRAQFEAAQSFGQFQYCSVYAVADRREGHPRNLADFAKGKPVLELHQDALAFIVRQIVYGIEY
jgi:hypothetical protein